MATKKRPEVLSQKAVSTSRKRKLEAPKHNSFRVTKKMHQLQKKPIDGAFTLLKRSFAILRANKRIFVGIILIQLLLSIIFVYSVGSLTSFSDLRYDVEQAFGDDLGRFGTAAALLGYLTGSLSSVEGAASVYQLAVTLITSLAIIWALRQLSAGHSIGIRDSYYKGMYPLIPFLLVLVVIGIQLIPAILGIFVYSTVTANELAVTTVERLMWLLLLILMLLLSAYMILSSIFALYIATLPEMTPLRALRSARGLVLNRRVAVALRLAVLMIVLIVVSIVVMLPVVLFVPVIAQLVFLLISGLGLFYIHSYLYGLYRALL